jgi:hypothetical protein
MKRIITFIATVVLVACGGTAEPGGDTDPGWSCSDGALVVDGPVSRIEARYPAASPPDRLLQHSTSPGMLITAEGEGWVAFELYEPVPAGDVATITTLDYSAEAPFCPVDVRVERGW